MNIKGLEKAAENYHNGTMALVEKLIGVPERQIKTTPIIIRKNNKTFCYISEYSNLRPDCNFIQPFIINGAFSLEVKMKFLSILETGVQLRGHNLLELYEQQTNDTKLHIRNKLKEIVINSDLHKKTISDLHSNYNLQFSWDTHLLISNSALAFERWRYSFENANKVTWFAGYFELQQTLNSRLSVLKS